MKGITHITDLGPACVACSCTCWRYRVDTYEIHAECSVCGHCERFANHYMASVVVEISHVRRLHTLNLNQGRTFNEANCNA